MLKTSYSANFDGATLNLRQLWGDIMTIYKEK